MVPMDGRAARRLRAGHLFARPRPRHYRHSLSIIRTTQLREAIIMLPNTVKTWTAVIFFAALAHASLAGYLDADGRDFVDAGFERSIVAFGVARGINAIISVIQGSEIALQPAGLGVTLTVGEILDPVNDLIERFRWVVLVTSVSFAIQKFVIALGAWTVFAYGCGAVFMLAAIALTGVLRPVYGFRGVIVKTALILAVIRFAVPTAAIANEIVYRNLLAERYQSASAEINGVHSKLKELESEPMGAAAGPSFDAAGGWTDKVGQFLDAVAATVDVRATWERKKVAYTEAVAEMTTSIVDVIAVFVIQTIGLPLLFLVVVWIGLRRLAQMRLPGLQG
jgi:hypothetical protein